MIKKTLVLGGSLKPERYSNKAIRRLTRYGHPVVSVGLKPGQVDGIEIETGFPDFEEIHTVTVYLGAENQTPYLEYVPRLKPKRVIFNPGTENEMFADICRKHDIEVVEHCTLVMLDSGEF